MENFIIRPCIGIGNLELGMSREQIHELLGSQCHTEIKDGIMCDYYLNMLIQICYDDNLSVNFIEISCSTECSVFYKETDIFKTKAEDLIQYLNKEAEYLNTCEARNGYGYIYEDLGLSLYRSQVMNEKTMKEQWFLELSQEQKEDELRFLNFEAVAVWSKGYYDTVKDLLLHNQG